MNIYATDMFGVKILQNPGLQKPEVIAPTEMF
jgi:hypothetical protein